ncbi:TIGR01777 family protein, partial [Dietzia sp. SLG310A2-38A2]|nr:TIGR01777 family protein [Dietzia sp. SLG310A2-38A2]
MSIDLSCTIQAGADEAWDYLASPGAFVRISPPFMPLRPVSQADSLRDGVAVLEPRSALPGPLGVRFGPRWIAQHDPAGYVEGERFVDRCVSQPYAGLTGWVHEHTVTEGPDGTAVLGDRVSARVPGPLLSPVFAYR